MRFLIVDDHPLFRAGLREVLRSLPEVVDVLEAGDVPEALGILAREPHIDWICLDLQLPGPGGIELIEHVHGSGRHVAVAVLSAVDQPATMERALTAGAVAYIAKSASADELTAAFDALRTQGFYLSPAIKRALADHHAGIVRQGARVVRLTRRQRQVLALIADGHANGGIAARLDLAESTVKAHVSTLFDLLGVDNRAGCVREAALLGLLGPA
ncbi:MAG: response regulator transcription factor [Gammaproteobacteria bacterium]